VVDFSIPTTVYCHRLKQRITFIAAPRDITAVLHFARLCDTLLCVSEQQLPPDASGALTLASLCAQGVPTTAYAIVALDQLSKKRRSEAKRMAAKLALDKFPDAKVHFFEKPSDASTTLWAVGNQKRRRVIWRELRAHVYGQTLAYDPVAQELAVSGYVRGRPLNVNGLVHLPGLGARPVARVLSAVDPSPMPSKGRSEDATMETGAGQVLASPNPEWQHSLQTEVGA
jgi:pre-rRNA-processing protein TSR1